MSNAEFTDYFLVLRYICSTNGCIPFHRAEHTESRRSSTRQPPDPHTIWPHHSDLLSPTHIN